MRREQKKKLGIRIRTVVYRTAAAFIIAGVLAGGFFVWKYYQQFFYEVRKSLVPQLVAVSFDHIYSQTLKNELSYFIAQKTTPEKLVSFNGADFSLGIEKSFPFIKHIIVSRPTVNHLSIEVVGAKPCLRFSDGTVLAHKSTLLNQEFFTEYGLEKIPKVELTQTCTPQSISKSLYGFFSKIPLSHWKKYQLTYDSLQKIYVRPQQSECKYTCIADQESLFDYKKLTQVEQLYEQLAASLQPTKKRNTMFIFDIRFADRIFISQQKGGGGNEYHHAI